MIYQPATISNVLGNLPQLPDWIASGRAKTLENVAFRSGAALTVLDQLISDPTHGVPVKLLANRLALKAATAIPTLEGIVKLTGVFLNRTKPYDKSQTIWCL